MKILPSIASSLVDSPDGQKHLAALMCVLWYLLQCERHAYMWSYENKALAFECFDLLRKKGLRLMTLLEAVNGRLVSLFLPTPTLLCRLCSSNPTCGCAVWCFSVCAHNGAERTRL